MVEFIYSLKLKDHLRKLYAWYSLFPGHSVVTFCLGIQNTWEKDLYIVQYSWMLERLEAQSRFYLSWISVSIESFLYAPKARKVIWLNTPVNIISLYILLCSSVVLHILELFYWSKQKWNQRTGPPAPPIQHWTSWFLIHYYSPDLFIG